MQVLVDNSLGYFFFFSKSQVLPQLCYSVDFLKPIGLTDSGMREQGSTWRASAWEWCGWNFSLLESSSCNTHKTFCKKTLKTDCV